MNLLDGIAIAEFSTLAVVRWNVHILLILLGVSIYTSGLHANELSVFGRCYSLFTGKQLESSHRFVPLVQSGQLSATDACMQIFSLAELQPNGLTYAEANNLSADEKEEALSVLRNFYRLHREWFPQQSFAAAVNNEDSAIPTEDIYDRTEAANYVSYILFRQGELYKNLLQGDRVIRAIRDGVQNDPGLVSGYPRAAFYHDEGERLADGGTGGVIPFDVLFLEKGKLRGFRPTSTVERERSVQISNSDSSNVCGVSETHYLKGFGGGAMGTSSYFILNSDFGRKNNGFWYRSNGGVRLARRWSKAVFSDFLCRDLPVATLSQVEPALRPSSGLSFRQGPSCNQCHATIDGMAGVVRNLSLKLSFYNTGTGFPDLPIPQQTVHVEQYPLSEVTGAPMRTQNVTRCNVAASPSNPQPVYYKYDPSAYLSDGVGIFNSDSDSSFYRRPPKAPVYFSDWKGDEVTTEVTGLDELGALLSSQDDFYMCAAQRYVHYLTGADVSFLNIAGRSEEDESIAVFIRQLGSSLKSNQSLKQMLREIISSEEFRKFVIKK